MNPFLDPTNLRRAADILEAQPELAKGVYYDARIECYCTMGALIRVNALRLVPNFDEDVASREIIRLAKAWSYEDVFKFNDDEATGPKDAAELLRRAASALEPISEADRLQHIEDICDNAERRQAARARSADQ